MVTQTEKNTDYYAIPVIGPAVTNYKSTKIGYLTGCFVGLHKGHKAFLKEASQLKHLNKLIVFMDSDDHVIDKWDKKGLDIRPDPRLKRRFFDVWDYLAELEREERKTRPDFTIRLVHPYRGTTTSESFFITLQDTIYMFCNFEFIMIEDYKNVEKWQDKYIDKKMANATYLKTVKDKSGKKISSKKVTDV